MLEIVHGGQTGVDRGAHQAALHVKGWKPTGFMPQNGKDELGLIPREVAKYLHPESRGGYASRTKANLMIANALLVIVENAAHATKTPGTKLTIEWAGTFGRSFAIADGTTPPAAIAGKLQGWVDHYLTEMRQVALEQGPFRLMVAGPRESKWRRARATTFTLLTEIAQYSRAKG